MSEQVQQENRMLTMWRQAALFFLPLTALHLGFNFSLGDFFFFGAVLVTVSSVNGYHKPIVVLALATGSLVFVCTAVLYLSGAATGKLIDGLQALVIFAFVIPVGWCVLEGLTLRQVCLALIGAAIVNATAVSLQLAFPFAYLPTQSEFGMAEFGLRPLGLTGNPNGLGLLMVWAIPIAVYLGADAKNNLSAFFWAGVTVFVAFTGMLSFSKAALVGIPVTLAVSQVMLGRRPQMIGGILLVGCFVLFWVFRAQIEWLFASLSYRLFSPDSLDSRMEGVADAWANIGEWIWFGAGPGGDAVYGSGVAQIHNQIFGFFVQFGIFSALAFWSLKALLIFEAFRLLGKSRVRVVGIVFLVAELTMLVHPVYWTRAHYLPVLLLLWIVNKPSPNQELIVGGVGE